MRYDSSAPMLQMRTPELATASPRQAPELSILLPTRNEAGNILPLLSRIEDATRGITTEVVFVDDSADATPDVIRDLGGRFPLTITLIVRSPWERTDGLGGAVVRGLRAAQAPWVCVMDADLQHPPEAIPAMLACAQESDADLVIASRRHARSDARQLGTVRTWISRSLDAMARLMFPSRLRAVSDPLTGFFLIRREAIVVDRLRPRGFKILLEILVRFPNLKLSEVPFEFGERQSGESKASMSEVLRYLRLLWMLRFDNNRTWFPPCSTLHPPIHQG